MVKQQVRCDQRANTGTWRQTWRHSDSALTPCPSLAPSPIQCPSLQPRLSTRFLTPHSLLLTSVPSLTITPWFLNVPRLQHPTEACESLFWPLLPYGVSVLLPWLSSSISGSLTPLSLGSSDHPYNTGLLLPRHRLDPLCRQTTPLTANSVLWV